MKTNLICIAFACLSTFVSSNFCMAQELGSQLKLPKVLIEAPDRDLVDDIFDYRLQFAFPAQYRYVLEEYSMDGERLTTYKHDSLESAEAQKDFLETRMMNNYIIVEIEIPQTWMTYDVYDLRSDARWEASGLEAIGFDTRIQTIFQFSKAK